MQGDVRKAREAPREHTHMRKRAGLRLVTKRINTCTPHAYAHTYQTQVQMRQTGGVVHLMSGQRRQVWRCCLRTLLVLGAGCRLYIGCI